MKPDLGEDLAKLSFADSPRLGLPERDLPRRISQLRPEAGSGARQMTCLLGRGGDLGALLHGVHGLHLFDTPHLEALGDQLPRVRCEPPLRHPAPAPIQSDLN